MDFKQHLNKIHAYYHSKTEKFQRKIIEHAIAILLTDIEDPRLTGPKCSPDDFMLRANQIGGALLENGLFSLAESLYRNLYRQTLDYREKTGNWRHAGALFANAGVACAAQGNFDKAIIELLKADKEDQKTYRTAYKKSFAITGLLKTYFGEPIKQMVLLTAQQVNPCITSDDIEALIRRIGEYEFAFLSYVYIAVTHEEAKNIFSNEFSNMQTLTALRNLSALLEVLLKTLNCNMKETLFPTLTGLYGSKGWWSAFDSTRTSVGAIRKPIVPVDIQLQNSIGLAPVDDISQFWKSLLIAYIVRNYTVHQMDFSGSLIQNYSQEALAHILDVMITAPKFK